MAESDKTQKATPHRRKKAREQGQLARSREVGSVLAMVGAAVTLTAVSGDMASHWVSFYQGLLTAACDSEFSMNGPVLFWSCVEVLRWIMPALLVAMFLSVGVTLAQGGLNFAPAAITPNVERLSPSNKLRQIVSFTMVSNVGKSLLPFLAIVFLAVGMMEEHWSELARASGEDLRTLLLLICELLRSIGWKVTLVLLAWAAVDYVLTWRQAEDRLRMSHDEVKREHKENEGNPFTKLRIRKRQRSMRQRKPLEAAATATLVVTNPTHFAVALRYELSMRAPEVVAKGRDLLAQRIKKIAQYNDVPLMENKPLARALYTTVEVGQVIPAELYQAVAEILVIVFRAQAEIREQEAMRRASSAAGEVIGNR